MFRLRTILQLFTGCFCLTLSATPPSGTILKCLKAYHQLARPRWDTSVELEMVSDRPVLSLFGSRTGTVSGILPNGELTDSIRKLFPGSTDSEIRQMEWRNLAPYQQLEILTEGGKRKGVPFYKDRTIPNVKYEEGVFADVKKTTLFLGKPFNPGLHTIRPSEYLKGPIEYMGPENYPGGVELHFRIRKSAGETSQEARNFQELIGVPPTHQHVYVVAPIPHKKLKKNPELVALQNAEFYRRVNLAAEMISIMEEGSRIRERTRGTGRDEVYIFGSLKPQNLVKMAQYLVEKGKTGAASQLKDELKMAWVGFRGDDKFDAPGLMGMEFRSINASTDLEVFGRFLNTVQKSWIQQNLGIKASEIETWFQQNYQGNLEKALTANWYQKDWKDVIQQTPRDLKQSIGWWGLRSLSKRMGNTNQEVKMIFHDWSKDPLFFQSPDKQNQIRQAQLEAIQSLKTNQTSIQSIMQTFLNDSGLYEATLNSLYTSPTN
ncbi:hypothetical protein EBR03_04600 [bacterium]|nr:hypothetical protein [bacterium]